MKAIATFHSPFKSKFGIPRQAGVVSELPGRIVLEKEYRSVDAIRGMDDFDYLWLVWQCSKSDALTVRPPRLGGNKHLGVFATRSPFRPNPIGLSSVRIDHIDYDCPDAPVIHVLGADLMDGTIIYDIKPYIPYTDSHPTARAGFTDSVQWQSLQVEFTPEAQTSLPRIIDRGVLESILSQDPRPHYHDDPERIYGMEYAGYDVRFRVSGSVLTVTDIVMKK
ncbi:MAG: tRNA (N6-threonylcarbamoyladenosine(37)-N6)-methyltransferase TrmO [Prevotella sp.]|nr:tRNA (N6-threonylcarbamoyladenosine(37)-N6)-methyltransferase TrmO [Prevotella sp.]